jgi:carbamoyl-phosphate synthase large subunit
MIKKILITGIGGDIAQCVAAILKKERPEIYLIGVDIHSQHGGTLFVDEFFNIPRADDVDYVNVIQTIIRQNDVDAVIPMTEPELGALLPLIVADDSVQWITPGEKVIAAGLDKLETMHALQGFGIPVPWTQPVSEAALQLPCMIKSRFGSGSRGVFKVESTQDAAYLSKKYPEAIFQEYLEPDDAEVTCAVYRTRDDSVQTLLLHRRLTGGFTGWARVIQHEETVAMCETIAKNLDLRGSMNIQLRITAKGPRVFEINPRFSSTVMMRHQIGFKDVLWALDEADGKTFQFSSIPYGATIVRTQGAVILENLKE